MCKSRAVEEDVVNCLIWMVAMSAHWFMLRFDPVQVEVDRRVSCSKLENEGLVLPAQSIYAVICLWLAPLCIIPSTSGSHRPPVQPLFFVLILEYLSDCVHAACVVFLWFGCSFFGELVSYVISKDITVARYPL